MTPPQSPRWAKLPGESVRAYGAFGVYRDLGPNRSIDAAWASQQSASPAGRAARSWFRWSKRFRWVERAQAFDAHLAAAALAQKEAEFQREAELWAQRSRHLRDRQWQLSQALLDKAESILRLPLVRTRIGPDGATIVEPVRVRAADAARLGQTASELGSQAVEAVQELARRGEGKVVRAVFSPPWTRDARPPDDD